MTTVVTPVSAIAARRACTAGASGVVRSLGMAVTVPSVPRVRVCTVPMRPDACPAAARPASTR